MERFAKIVCTLGPSVNTKKKLQSLINAGMNVARLNFSHGEHQDHEKLIKLIREISDEQGISISILQDLQGPKLRIGKLPGHKMELRAGDQVVLSSSEDIDYREDEKFIPFDIPDLHKALKPGNHILMDDGNLELEVQSVTGEQISAVVTLGGLLKSKKGVNLPGANLTFPIFTEKDRTDLKFGLENGVDMVAISFVKSSDDVRTVQKAIEELAPDKDSARTPIIAKLERPEALDDLQGIMRNHGWRDGRSR